MIRGRLLVYWRCLFIDLNDWNGSRFSSIMFAFKARS
jgi:hypothetical protein